MISEQQINIIINTLKPYNPTKIGALYVEDKDKIIVLFSFNSKPNLFTLGGLQSNLEEKLNKEISLGDFSLLYPVFKESILDKAQIIFEA